MSSLTQQFTDDVAVAEHIEQEVMSGRISTPTRKRGFKGKVKEVDHAEGSYRGRKNQFQTITLYPNLSTSISTLNFPPKNLSPKTSKSKTKLKIPLKKITKESRNNYLHYQCLWMRCTRSYWALDMKLSNHSRLCSHLTPIGTNLTLLASIMLALQGITFILAMPSRRGSCSWLKLDG